VPESDIAVFAQDAVDEFEKYSEDLAQAKTAVLEAVPTEPNDAIDYQQLVDFVAEEATISKVIVHTAVSELLKSGLLFSVAPYHLRRAAG
jgi:hypothetical protein